ncbi:hypothetical protein RMATCC62417_09046 [Rhizopus microsporus]|nr:hypothetical protein RMATCC62417_09046 [Rhizopus microsporus]
MAPSTDTTTTTTTTTTNNTAITPHLIKVNSPNVTYTDEHILSKYSYSNTLITKQSDGSLLAEPTETSFDLKTDCKVPRLG